MAGKSINKAEDVQQSWSKKRLISFQANFMFACWRHVTGAEICKEWSCFSGQNEISWSLSIKKDYDWLVCVCDRKGLVDSFLKVSKWKLRNTLQAQALPALAPMDEEKAVDHLLLPQRLSSACFYHQPCFGRWSWVTRCDTMLCLTSHGEQHVGVWTSWWCLQNCWEWFWVKPTEGSSVTKTGFCCSKKVKRPPRWYHPVLWNDIRLAAASGQPPLIPPPCMLCQIYQLLRCLGLGTCLWLLMAHLWFTAWFLACSIPFGCREIPACSQHV